MLNHLKRLALVCTAALVLSGPALPQSNATPSFKAITLPGGTLTGIATIGTPVDASVAQPAAGNLLSTIPANLLRGGYWFFENQSAATLAVTLDDGLDTASSKSVFVLGPGGAGLQGGSMGSADTGPHLGRIRVYGPAGSQFALRAQ